jgi:hypothetical protein
MQQQGIHILIGLLMMAGASVASAQEIVPVTLEIESGNTASFRHEINGAETTHYEMLTRPGELISVNLPGVAVDFEVLPPGGGAPIRRARPFLPLTFGTGAGGGHVVRVFLREDVASSGDSVAYQISFTVTGRQ